MRKITFSIAAAALFGASANTPADIRDVRLKGYVGDRLESCIRHHVAETDVNYLTDCFFDRTEKHGWWQTEFWGKYMHAAMPFAGYVECPRLRKAVDDGLDRVLAAQTPEGYIGNYPDDLRCGEGWDVWGMKYTMLGLLHYYDAAPESERGRAALGAARRLCDYVIAQLGDGGARRRRLYQTGNWCGFASSSILEPVVWLYKRTKEPRYLAFAESLVKDMSEPPEGPRLIDLALKGVPVGERNGYGNAPEKGTAYVMKRNRRKAYEMMSCYQGLLEFYEATGRKDCLDAAVATGRSIVRDEVNVCGGAAANEAWYGGAKRQHLPYTHLQETCVTTTWMRFCEKLLAVTGESGWADEIEKTFYNAYLAALRRDGGAFAAYTPLNGTRLYGHDHCHMHTDCCNANGPRGFLVFLRNFVQADGDAAIVNFYSSGRAAVTLPKLGEKVAFDQYTLYPKLGTVRLWNRTKKPLDFTLKLRIPAWSAKTSVKVNGEAVDGVRAGGYLPIRRTWRDGDQVEIDFDLSVKVHRLDHAVAFTRGPVALARDTRSGDVGEVLRAGVTEHPAFTLVRNEDPDVWITCAATLPFGGHSENPDGQQPAAATFVDYASAGNDWRPGNMVRTWFATEWRLGD